VRRSLLAIPVLLLLALLAGCGGGGDDETASTATATTATATTATTATGPAATTTPAAPRTERERVADCLRKLGYRLTGGAPQAPGPDTPEYQIILDSRRGGGYIGFYKNVSRAQRITKRLRANAQRTTGADVERHGAINVVWVDLADAASRERVRGCLVT
jgi:hypothetical protein